MFAGPVHLLLNLLAVAGGVFAIGLSLIALGILLLAFLGAGRKGA